MNLPDLKMLSLELLVVFLGVTAGFLLNNWQLEQQDYALEEKYIEGFEHDISGNIQSLEESVAADSLWLADVLPRIQNIRARILHPDSANIVLRKIVNISKLEQENSTYEEIINSGKLNIIHDFRLRKSIVDYYGTMDGVAFIENYFYTYFSDFVMPFLFEHFNVLEGKMVDPGIRHSVKFANVIAGYYSMMQQRQKAYIGLLEKARALRSLLEEFREAR